MSLLDTLNQDMKQAMRNKEKQKLSTIRMVKASLQNEAIKLGNESLSEEAELTVLARELKQRKDPSVNLKKLDAKTLLKILIERLNFYKCICQSSYQMKNLKQLLLKPSHKFKQRLSKRWVK